MCLSKIICNKYRTQACYRGFIVLWDFKIVSRHLLWASHVFIRCIAFVLCFWYYCPLLAHPSISVNFSLLMGKWWHWHSGSTGRLHVLFSDWSAECMIICISETRSAFVHLRHVGTPLTSTPIIWWWQLRRDSFFFPSLFCPISTPRRLAAHHVRDDSKPRHLWRRSPESLLRVPAAVTGCSGPDCNWCQSDDGSHPPTLNRSSSCVTADHVFYY